MKKKIITIFIVLLAGIIIYSCRKEFDGPQKIDRSEGLTVKEANSYFKAHFKNSATERSFARGRSLGLRPLWHRAKLGSTNRSSFVEMPLQNLGLSFTPYAFDNSGKVVPSDPVVAKYVFKRLILYKNSATGEIVTRVLTYVPDLSYLKRNGFDATKVGIKTLNGYSGYIQVHTTEDEPISIYKYIDGKKILKLTPGSSIAKIAAVAQGPQARGVIVVCTPIMTWGCWDSPEAPGGQMCSEPVQTGESCTTTWIPDPDPDPDPNEPGETENPPGSGTGTGTESGNSFMTHIKVSDTSITNNPKIKCLLDKLLGLNGTTGNAEMKSLLAAFVGKGFDVTFKIGTMRDPNSKGETGPDANDPTKYNIVLDRTKINVESQMSWVKVLLHEAFHANLMQKSYEMFGNYAVGLWPIGPKDLSLIELMDKIESLAQPQPTLAQQHHEFMAMNIGFIKDGLKSFSLANTTNHTSFNEDRFEALAYQGFELTSYYINKVCKDANGNIIMLDYSGGNYTLAQVHNNKAGDLMTNSVIPCN